MPPKTHDTMNAKQAAKYARKSQLTLAMLARQGKLTTYRTPSGQVRYSIAELNRLRRG